MTRWRAANTEDPEVIAAHNRRYHEENADNPLSRENLDREAARRYLLANPPRQVTLFPPERPAPGAREPSAKQLQEELQKSEATIRSQSLALDKAHRGIDELKMTVHTYRQLYTDAEVICDKLHKEITDLQNENAKLRALNDRLCASQEPQE